MIQCTRMCFSKYTEFNFRSVVSQTPQYHHSWVLREMAVFQKLRYLESHNNLEMPIWDSKMSV